MKKKIIFAVSFSSLLTLSAVAPSIFWENSQNVGRFPASEEANEEASKQDTKIKNEGKLEVQAETLCSKDKDKTDLEKDIIKLIEDKKAILKEIDDLKVKNEKVSLDDKESKKLSQHSDNEEIISLISQMTSMMISQQQQQQMLMQQTFTMMNQMQLQMLVHFPMQSYPQQDRQLFSRPQYLISPIESPNSSLFGHFGPRIGVGDSAQSMLFNTNPYAAQSRYPSGEFEPEFVQKDVNVQPQFQTQYPAGNTGYNFLTSDALSEMQRIQF